MTDQLTRLLHDAASEPGVPPDVDRFWRAGRRRRLRTRIAFAGTAAVLVFSGIAVVSTLPDSPVKVSAAAVAAALAGRPQRGQGDQDQRTTRAGEKHGKGPCACPLILGIGVSSRRVQRVPGVMDLGGNRLLRQGRV